MEHQQHGAMPGTSTPQNKTPTTGAPEEVASNFQQKKKAISQFAHRFFAILSVRCICLGDLLPILLVVAGLIVLELAK